MPRKPHNKLEAASRRAEKRIASVLRRLFFIEKKRIATWIADAYTPDASKATRAAKLLKDLKLDGWTKVVKKISPALESVSAASGGKALTSLGFDTKRMFNEVNSLALEFAEDRAAEMVGMMYVDGDLVVNPDPYWSITDSTRDMLQDLVEKAFDTGLTRDQLREEVLKSQAFSEGRAHMIAQTEVSLAQNNGQLDGWKTSGVVIGKEWVLSDDHEIEDECDDNDGERVAIEDAFPSGDQSPPAHPHCFCGMVPVMEDEKL